MITEPLTLYKLMILYLLKSVNYPLTNNQLSGFFLDYEYTTYFTLQQCISELVEARLMNAHSTKNVTRYEITKEGSDTLEFFQEDITPGAIADMNRFLKENKLRLRAESSTYTDYYEGNDGSFIVHTEVREENQLLFSLELSVPDKDSAELMCSKWAEKNSVIYGFIIKQLLGSDK